MTSQQTDATGGMRKVYRSSLCSHSAKITNLAGWRLMIRQDNDSNYSTMPSFVIALFYLDNSFQFNALRQQQAVIYIGQIKVKWTPFKTQIISHRMLTVKQQLAISEKISTLVLMTQQAEALQSMFICTSFTSILQPCRKIKQKLHFHLNILSKLEKTTACLDSDEAIFHLIAKHIVY